MYQHTATPDTQERSSVGRRTVLKGAAWSVPVVAVVGATPAFAKTGDTVTFDSVVVNTAPTGAPNNYYINISNQNSSVTVGGTVTSGAIVTVTWPGHNETATTTGATWTHNILDNKLPEGTLSFNASVAGPPVVSVPGPHTVVKDTAAPALTYVGQSTASNGKSGSATGAYGVLTTPTADALPTYGNFVGGTDVTVSGFTTSSGTWTLSWTYSGTGNVKRQTMTVDIHQSDGAGNSTTLAVSWTA